MIDACPRDRAPLATRRAHGIEALSCRTCSGLWLPARAVAAIAGHRPDLRSLRARADRATGLHCPDDGAPLLGATQDGIEIDLCPQCGGLWLDHGELERLLGRRGTRTAEYVADVAINSAISLGSSAKTSACPPPCPSPASGDVAEGVLSIVGDFIGNFLSGL